MYQFLDEIARLRVESQGIACRKLVLFCLDHIGLSVVSGCDVGHQPFAAVETHAGIETVFPVEIQTGCFKTYIKIVNLVVGGCPQFVDS